MAPKVPAALVRTGNLIVIKLAVRQHNSPNRNMYIHVLKTSAMTNATLNFWLKASDASTRKKGGLILQTAINSKERPKT